MLNKVMFEGIVTSTWKYAGDLFARLACYRDPAIEAKRLNETQDAPDYVNVRWPNAAQQMVEFPRGTHLRVEGFFQSREYTETLAEFMRKANKTGATGVELTGPEARQITCGRNTVEIVAREHIILNIPQPQPVRPQPAVRKPVLAAKPAPAVKPAPAEATVKADEPLPAAPVEAGQPKPEKTTRKPKAAPAVETQTISTAPVL